MRNHVIFFSGGKSSFTVAHLVKEKYPDDNIVLYFTDTKWEDEDLHRFIHEAASKLKLPMLYHALGLDPVQLMFKQKAVYNSRIGNCSTILKMGVAADYFKRNIEPPEVEWFNKEYLKLELDPSASDFAENTTLYFGIGWEEVHREAAIKKNWLPFKVEMPLIDEAIDNQEVLELYDIRQPRLYDYGFTHNNCFKGSEKYITDEGIKTFEGTVGKQVKVLGMRGNWQEADIKHFGKQKLVELVVEKSGKKKTIFTTAEHRWFVRKNRKQRREVLTKELRSGDFLWSMHNSIQNSIKVSPVGIAHGIVYGDGTYPRSSWNNPASVTLCGQKEELAMYFPLNDKKEVKGVGVKVTDLPKYWKDDKPALSESKSYLLGWLAGYVATDGSVEKGGSSISIASSKIEDLEYVADLCAVVGISTNVISMNMRKGFNKTETPIYTISLVDSNFSERILLRRKHKESYKPSTFRPKEWKVVSVNETAIIDDVYCAVVPNGEAFTLEGNIYTGNCKGRCVKAGQGHFINLLQQMPELFKETMAYEHHMSKYVATNHYLRKQKYYPESEQIDDDALEIMLSDLDDAYRDYFNGEADKPGIYVHPSISAAPFEVDKMVVDRYYISTKTWRTNKEGERYAVRKLNKKTTASNRVNRFIKSDKYRLIETRHMQQKSYAYMKKTKDKITRPYPLRNLYWDALAEGLDQKPNNVIVQKQHSVQLDLFDVGGCGCDFSQTDASACDITKGL